MNIVYIATNSYVSALGISLTSLFENSKDIVSLNIYFLSPDLNHTNQSLLTNLAEKYKRKIYYININDYQDIFSHSSHTSGFHPIVLARLLLSEYLPESLTSVLYLDCDVIINSSIAELQNINLSNYAFAAIPELYMPPARKRQLGLALSQPYYNSGVLLINLSFWRTHNLKDKFFEYYNKAGEKLLYPDQDVLNFCCQNQILELSHKYNFSPALRYFPRYFIKKYQPAYYRKNKEDYFAIIKKPAIIHFLGEERPWFRGNFNPYRNIYKYYKELSPWKNMAQIQGKEIFLLCYHFLNCITVICPWFRKLFTELIGIRYYKIAKKK